MRPGVYVQEAPLPRVIASQVGSISAGAFIGTALMGPSDPTLILSWSQFVNTFGTFSPDDKRTSLAPAVYQFFANGGAQCYVHRVLSGDALSAQVTLGDADGNPTLGITAASAGYWGNGLSVDIVHPYDPKVVNPDDSTGPFTVEFGQRFDRMRDWRAPLIPLEDVTSAVFDLVVRNTVRGVSVIVERFSQVSLNPLSSRYIERIVNDSTVGSSFVVVKDMGNGQTPDAIPAVVERQALTHGSDGKSSPTIADYVDAMDQFELVEGNLLFNIPGVHEMAGVEQKVAARGDSFLVVDGPLESQIDKVLETAFPVTSYAAVYYPWVAIPDPDPSAQRGSMKWVPPGGSVVGMIMRTDASRGSFKAPAGVGASLTGVVATSRKMTNAELDLLNTYQINAIRPVPGAGITVMGARTRDFSTTARYISVRRTLNYIKERTKSISEFALFEPNSTTLWEQLRVANGAFLSELWQVGGLAGRTLDEAFYVKVDSDNNPPQAIANGEVHIEIGVAPIFPAEFVIIRLGQFEAEASFVVTEE